MTAICSILEDKREINNVWDGPAVWTVGYRNVTKIVVYREAGQMGFAPWAAICSGEQIIHRVSLANGGVTYKENDQ